ncbi:MAG: uracil-DNA glycosylase [Fibromonadaceae bacterium]|jgi:uracil-DNA glycosylase|nr:uracil-DNA glycosylase [Fibromonadaceae bacterium]
MLDIHASWTPIKSLLYETLNEKILPNLSNTKYQPEREDIFNVFKMPVSDIKVIILGQDPYPTEGNAMGYAFAVPADKKIPASLRVIKEEIVKEFAIPCLANHEHPEWRTLKDWRDSGVFLLNTALTIEAGKIGSHLGYWKNCIGSVIKYISKTHPCIWMLWGKKAQSFKGNICNALAFDIEVNSIETIEKMPINNKTNYILEAPHPTARGNTKRFKGCNHFLYADAILRKLKKREITWIR